jgi:hypothetical protein
MAIPDLVNAVFELGGAIISWINVIALWRHKQVRGVFWPLSFFWTAWGLWNLYYYAALNQRLSWVAGCVLTSASVAWFVLATYYTHKERHGSSH